MRFKLASLASLIFYSSLASAQSSVSNSRGIEPLLQGLRNAIGWIVAILETILDIVSLILFDSRFYGELVYTKMLFFFLILIILYYVLKKNTIISEKRSINVLVSLCISILSVRFLPDSLIQGIRIPYGALAVSILVFLPLVIFFFFLHNNDNFKHFGRRFGWVIYGAVFLALWADDANKGGITNIVYGIGLAFVIFSIFFDNSVHRWMGFRDYSRYAGNSEREIRGQIKLAIADATRDLRRYERHGMTHDADLMKKKIKRLERRLKSHY